jgi:hypothetical protein
MDKLKFRFRQGKLDWAKLVRVNLEHVVRTVDIEPLQENLQNITFSDITEEDLAYCTLPHFLQLVRIFQLTVEYLIYVQNYLLRQTQDKEHAFQKKSAEFEKLKELAQGKLAKFKQLSIEFKNQKQLLEVYKMSRPAESMHACEFPNCEALFRSSHALSRHVVTHQVALPAAAHLPPQTEAFAAALEPLIARLLEIERTVKRLPSSDVRASLHAQLGVLTSLSQSYPSNQEYAATSPPCAPTAEVTNRSDRRNSISTTPTPTITTTMNNNTPRLMAEEANLKPTPIRIGISGKNTFLRSNLDDAAKRNFHPEARLAASDLAPDPTHEPADPADSAVQDYAELTAYVSRMSVVYVCPPFVNSYGLLLLFRPGK